MTPKLPDTSDPGKAAAVFYAGAWLFAQVAMMQAMNTERERSGYALAYGEESFAAAIEDAESMFEAKP